MKKKEPPYQLLVYRLDTWARYMRAHFGSSPMIVGGALKDEQPRDVDIVLVIPDREFEGRYHQTAKEWDHHPGERWIKDMQKFNTTLAWGQRINVDFKVQPESEACKFKRKKRVLLGHCDWRSETESKKQRCQPSAGK